MDSSEDHNDKSRKYLKGVSAAVVGLVGVLSIANADDPAKKLDQLDAAAVAKIYNFFGEDTAF